MNIGLDISGGDFAPEANVLGALLAIKELPDHVSISLIGKANEISTVLESQDYDSDRIKVVDAPDVITMHDHPTRAIPQKPQSSISARRKCSQFG